MPFSCKLEPTLAKYIKIRGQIFNKRDEHEKANTVHNLRGGYHYASLFVRVGHTGCTNAAINTIFDE